MSYTIIDKANRSLRYLLLILTVTAGSTSLRAQDLDSLFNTFLILNGHQPTRSSAPQIQPVDRDYKCGFGLSAQIKEHFNSFNENQKGVITKLMGRPDTLDVSRVSPSGFFRIHYDTSGINAPAYFSLPDLTLRQNIEMSIDSLVAALDSSYNFEINILGYNPPLPDNGEGGDDLYDVYVRSISDYGYVTPVEGYVPTYMNIHNSFTGFPTSGIDAAKVTAAHEFHHSIQLANYGWHGYSEAYFYEMTSTAMEEFVYDDINDYYRVYLIKFFRTPSSSLVGSSDRGYQDGIFFIYLQERFLQDENSTFKGYDIIKMAWELFAGSSNAIESIAGSLVENGSSLTYEYANFGTWCFFTGNRSIPGKYFEEAKYYPQITPFASYEFNSTTKEYSINSYPVSNNYLVFTLTDQGFHDSLVTIISNSDIEGTDDLYPNFSEVNYTLTTDSNLGSNHIVNNYYSEIETTIDDFITESNIFNNEVVSNQTIQRQTLDYAYPQPFVYGRDNELFIPAEPNTLEFADLNIYTSGMNLIYSGKVRIIAGEKIIVKWNACDNNGDKLPTGIYIYAVKSGDKVTKGKFAVYND